VGFQIDPLSSSLLEPPSSGLETLFLPVLYSFLPFGRLFLYSALLVLLTTFNLLEVLFLVQVLSLTFLSPLTPCPFLVDRRASDLLLSF